MTDEVQQSSRKINDPDRDGIEERDKRSGVNEENGDGRSIGKRRDKDGR